MWAEGNDGLELDTCRFAFPSVFFFIFLDLPLQNLIYFTYSTGSIALPLSPHGSLHTMNFLSKRDSSTSPSP
jgi:hypothetical protein